MGLAIYCFLHPSIPHFSYSYDGCVDITYTCFKWMIRNVVNGTRDN